VLADHPTYTILLSKDLDASRHFYHDVLGLEVLREDLGEGVEERIVFKTANGRLILSKSTVGTSDTQTQMAWMVPDIRAAIEDLRARGVRIEEYQAPDPVTVDGVADLGYSWAAWFIDPSNNCLAIVQPKE
jgi:catechol 2,3-dioxygenase-like lactoylglutathione lyase family enzyme